MNKETNPAPRCPYCGAEMRLEDNEDVLYGLFGDEERMYWYQCTAPSCDVHSPAQHTENGAYKAAIAHWQEPNRVLTLEEVVADADADDWLFAWVEREEEEHYVRQYCAWYVTNSDVIIVLPGDDHKIYMRKHEYGVTWRCWERKPTPEEMANTPWEENDG